MIDYSNKIRLFSAFDEDTNESTYVWPYIYFTGEMESLVGSKLNHGETTHQQPDIVAGYFPPDLIPLGEHAIVAYGQVGTLFVWDMLSARSPHTMLHLDGSYSYNCPRGGLVALNTDTQSLSDARLWAVKIKSHEEDRSKC